MQFTGFIRKVFAPKILLSGKFSPFLTLLPPTSDIKMIDIWLVLCQMVPFAEVILLTAIEYHREEEDQGQNGNMIMQKNAENQEEDASEEEEESRRCWTPQLKTLGNIF